MPNPYLAAALREQQDKRAAAVAENDPAGYDALTVPDLRDEISRRNEGRAESDQIVPSGALKADLTKALEADDNNPPETEES